MPETSTPTLTPDGTTKIPAFQNNNPGNVEVDALKAYILSQAGLANGLATLDENGKLDSSQIPVNLDDVLVYASYASLPATGETGKLYITSDVNGTYYWNGTSYQILNQSFVRYRGSLSSLPSDPQPGDWFIAASSFSSYTSGHIYLYNGSSWDDVTAVFGQFVLKTDIAQTLGQQTDKVPSNKAVDDAINAIIEPINYSSITILDNNVSFADTEANCGFKIGNFVLYHLSLNLSAPVSNVDILSFPYAPIDYTRIVYNHQHGSIAMPFVARYTGNLFVAGTLDSGQVSIMVMYKKN